MKEICDILRTHGSEVLDLWEGVLREEPWFSLPRPGRIDHLPEVVAGLAEAALGNPADRDSHRSCVESACVHGSTRRSQGIPENHILTEYHLLRRALWQFLLRHLGPGDRSTRAIIHLDRAIAVASNASLWGYYREEIVALGKWDQGISRIVESSLAEGSRSGT